MVVATISIRTLVLNARKMMSVYNSRSLKIQYFGVIPTTYAIFLS